MPRTSRLPASSAPLTLPDGTTVRPSTAQPYESIEVPSTAEAQRIVAATRRKLVDLPALPKQMNSYAVVLCYTASGLSDNEISVATGFTVAQIANLRQQPAYSALEGMVLEAVKSQASTAVKEILVKGEVRAAHRLVTLAESEDDRIALSATKDLLDRGGHKAAERLDINAHIQNTFRIEVVDKRDSDAPVIDVEAE